MGCNRVVLYIHGKGGSALEAEHYRGLFPRTDVYGFEYKADNPWDAKAEFAKEAVRLKSEYKDIILVANSIGAYYSMNAGIDDLICKAYFISPIVNMEQLITDMLCQAGATEKELEENKIISVEFGDDLSWEYLQYVRNNTITWSVPTEILYGSEDNLQSIDTIKAFACRVHANITVMNGGEHWFHTEEQMRFLDEWIKKF